MLYTQIGPMASELFHAYGRTDGMIKVKDAFHKCCVLSSTQLIRSPSVVFFPIIKPTDALMFKLYFLHKIPRNSNIFRSLSIIFMELLNVTKAYIETWMDNFNISVLVSFIK